MRKIREEIIIIFIVLSSTFVASLFSWAGVANTKHNLSVTGPGTIKATEETEICVFCHIPHNANPAVPLWNHEVSGAAYTMYNSEYLQRANYTIPTELGQFPNIGYRSRLCLSCHDGTVAIGSIYILRGSVLTSPISMQGVTAEGKLPATSNAYIGTDLTNDHPVAIEYNTGKQIVFGSGIRSMELNATVPPIVGVDPGPFYDRVRLYGPSPGYVECSSCHDPHTENEKFLVIWNTNLATTIDDLCQTCHDKIDWSISIHYTSTAAYTDSSVLSNYGDNTIDSLSCTNCHKSHGGQGSPYWYLLRKIEENTCFDGAASLSSGAPCHGTGAATGGKDIESVISRTYSHPVTTISGEHTDLDVLDPTYIDWIDDKHAECVDCHNPHQARQGTHNVPSDPTGWYPQSPSSTTNQISNALQGVTGVEPDTEPTNWAPPTSYTTYNEAVYEYQICFKCHSYYALQDIDGVTTYTTASGAIVTDQAMEFSRGNRSAHPVRVALNSQTGSYAPQALTSSQMSPPWDINVGNQTMYCSDCHGTDNEASIDPTGPHGSSYKYMLKGPRKYWPASSTGKLFSLNDISGIDQADPPYDGLNTNWANELFCLNCHPLYSSGTWKNSAHQEHDDREYRPDGTTRHNIYCIACHSVIPHGNKRSRLIVYGTSDYSTADPEPYIYVSDGVNYSAVAGFKKVSNYDVQSCYSTVTGCTTHTNQGGYDD